MVWGGWSDRVELDWMGWSRLDRVELSWHSRVWLNRVEFSWCEGIFSDRMELGFCFAAKLTFMPRSESLRN